jgi:fucokinase
MSDARRLNLAMEANATAYRRAVQTSVPGECWDFVILTAANEKQAEGYRHEIALRHRAVGPIPSFFPAIQRSLVVPDPPGPRIGSGGATLGAIRALAAEHHLAESDFNRLRILLIHSGGMSQRLPAYSPLGKIFAPLPLLRPDGQIATLFDHLYLTLAGLPDRLGPGMLILAGDVFLLFDHRHVTAPSPGVTALTMRVEGELARDHGVFATNPEGRIGQTLQKAPVESMQAVGAADAQGKVLIDTGLLFFDPTRTRLLAKLAGIKAASESRPKKSSTAKSRQTNPKRGIDQRHKLQLDLYDDVTAALASGTQRDQFLRPGPARKMRGELWRAFHGIPFNAMQLEGEFLHLGTTRQFRDAMIGRNPSPAALLFQQNVLAYSDWHLDPGRRVYHSVLLSENSRPGLVGAGAVVEHSILRAPSRIGEGSVVSQVLADSLPIELADNLLLFQVPCREKSGDLVYVQAVCGVDDDFKGKYFDGKCRYLNEPISLWFERHGISPSEVWSKTPLAERTLWNARVFPATQKRDAARLALRLATYEPVPATSVNAWRKAPRYSMEMVLQQADPAALIEHREVVAAYLQARQMLDIIRRRESLPVDSVIGHYRTAAAYQAVQRLLSDWSALTPQDPETAIDQARALWCGVQLLQRPDHPELNAARPSIEAIATRAFSKIALASEMGHASISVGQTAPRVLTPGHEITATAPVRIDLSGGWSDTPPHCFECGGHVINLAVDLEGKPPVRAIIRTLESPQILLESTDLGRQIELTPEQLAAPLDVRDPFALHKAALGIAGILPTETGTHWKKKPLGAGLHIRTECRVPKGSGLGTSSILAAALLAALHELRGRQATTDQIIEQTLLLEQRLGTGGGWQDQIGGLIGGAVSTTTAPGIPQKPSVEKLSLTDERYSQLEQRLVLYFSGQQRLARDILRRAMGRWLAREPAVVLLMERLKQSAAGLRTALLAGNWTSIAREISTYWQMKKELYSGSTTPSVDLLLLETRHLYQAAGLAGAGGGGFGYFLCESPEQATQLRDFLAERSTHPGSLGSVHEKKINRQGLTVTHTRA